MNTGITMKTTDLVMKTKILCNLDATMLVLSPSSDRDLILAMVTIHDVLLRNEMHASSSAFWVTRR